MNSTKCTEPVENDITKQLWILTEHLMFLEANVHQLVERLADCPALNKRSPEDMKCANPVRIVEKDVGQEYGD